MDFVVGLPFSLEGIDSTKIIVIDGLNQPCFNLFILPTNWFIFTSEKSVVYMGTSVYHYRKWHSVQLHFWGSIESELGTRVELSITFHL